MKPPFFNHLLCKAEPGLARCGFVFADAGKERLGLCQKQAPFFGACESGVQKAVIEQDVM